MGIKALLGEIGDQARLDGRPLPVLTTDRISARILGSALAHEIGCSISDLRSPDLPFGTIAMYDGVRIAFPIVDTSDPARDVSKQVAALGEKLMAVSDAVSSILALAQQNQTLVGSVDSAMKALSLQVSDLQSQIMTSTPSLSADDQAALVTATEDLQQSIATLKADIPTNVTAVGTTASSAAAETAATAALNPAAAATTQEAMQAATDQHEADASAAAQAKPIAGTGTATAH